MPSTLIVVVRYQVPLPQAPVMRGLAESVAREPALRDAFTTLVWDNSPEPAPELPRTCFPFDYRHTGENLGVSGAYNRAMEMAEQCGCAWLLLLDQDSTMPEGFLAAMLRHATRLAGDEQVAAVAPQVCMGEAVVSPKLTQRFGGAVDFPADFAGPEAREVVLVNTGLLLRVAALRRIGGFSPEFWLDFSDRYLCHMLAKHGYAVWIASKLRLAHHVSLMAGEGGMSEDRYANLVAAEDAYFSLYKSLPRNLVYRYRLLRSAWSERNAHPERTRLLLRHFLRRLYLPRATRLRAWREQLAQRGMAVSHMRSE